MGSPIVNSPDNEYFPPNLFSQRYSLSAEKYTRSSKPVLLSQKVITPDRSKISDTHPDKDGLYGPGHVLQVIFFS